MSARLIRVFATAILGWTMAFAPHEVPAAERPEGRLLRVEGEVSLVDAKGVPTPIRPLPLALYAGMRLRVPAGARAELTHYREQSIYEAVGPQEIEVTAERMVAKGDAANIAITAAQRSIVEGMARGGSKAGGGSANRATGGENLNTSSAGFIGQGSGSKPPALMKPPSPVMDDVKGDGISIPRAPEVRVTENGQSEAKIRADEKAKMDAEKAQAAKLQESARKLSEAEKSKALQAKAMEADALAVDAAAARRAEMAKAAEAARFAEAHKAAEAAKAAEAKNSQVAMASATPSASPAELYGRAMALRKEGKVREATRLLRQASAAGYGPASKVLYEILASGEGDQRADHAEAAKYGSVARSQGVSLEPAAAARAVGR